MLAARQADLNGAITGRSRTLVVNSWESELRARGVSH